MTEERGGRLRARGLRTPDSALVCANNVDWRSRRVGVLTHKYHHQQSSPPTSLGLVSLVELQVPSCGVASTEQAHPRLRGGHQAYQGSSVQKHRQWELLTSMNCGFASWSCCEQAANPNITGSRCVDIHCTKSSAILLDHENRPQI